MSGYWSGRSPDDDQHWARDVEQRLVALEQGKTAVRVGGWVLADRDGEVVLTDQTGRVINLTTVLGQDDSPGSAAATLPPTNPDGSPVHDDDEP